MNQKHLLRFMKKMVKTNPDEHVCKNSEGEEMKLYEVCSHEVAYTVCCINFSIMWLV